MLTEWESFQLDINMLCAALRQNSQQADADAAITLLLLRKTVLISRERGLSRQEMLDYVAAAAARLWDDTDRARPSK
jgi:hypothetical protein